jgi:hypothetical protein
MPPRGTSTFLYSEPRSLSRNWYQFAEWEMTLIVPLWVLFKEQVNGKLGHVLKSIGRGNLRSLSDRKIPLPMGFKGFKTDPRLLHHYLIQDLIQDLIQG